VLVRASARSHDPIPWHDINHALLCLGAYIAVLLIGSLLIFKRKDVLA